MSNRIPYDARPNLIHPARLEHLRRTDLHARLHRRDALWFSMGRRVPDLLTLSRGVLGLMLVWLGAVNTTAALAQDIWILVLAWTTDMLDGRISRSLRTENQTWVGKNDVYIDLFVSLAVLAYLTLTGLLALGIAVAYLLVWGAVFLRWGMPPVAAQVFQNPIYAWFVFLAVRAAPEVLPWLLLWAAAAMALFWRRWVQLMRDLFKTVKP